ncbi:MAG: fibronectin type III domain-containing protein [Rikenellaceae bacterium]|nr:fibronectin type III domain-containing protein [Rikenellaceae bacterium]
MKIFKTFMCLAAAAMAFTGCADEGAGVVDNMNVDINFTATDASTRTSFGEPTENSYPTLWTGNETVKIGLNNAGSSSKSDEAKVTASEDGKTATWTANITDDESGSYTLYALCPASAYLSTKADGWGVTIPDTQTPTENSCDEAAQIIVSKSSTTTVLPTTVEMDFSHVTAYGCFSLTNLALGEAKITSVALTAEVGFAGRWDYDFASASMTENSTSNTITINTDKTENIWFACAPGNLAGTTLTVVVNTDQGTFTKEIDMPDGCEFKSGYIARFAVNMEGISIVGPVKYSKLTNISDLSIGDQVIIAAADYDYAISTTQNSNNRAQTAITKSENGSYITDPSSSVQIFTVEAGTVAGSFAFYTGSGYIYAASSSSNHLKTEATLSANSSWAITITDGEATMEAKGGNTRNTLQYNANSSLFSCYGSASQKAVAIYYIASVEKTALATPEVTATVEGTTITATWAQIENAASYTVSCRNTTTDVTTSKTVTETTCTFEDLESGMEYEVSVIAVPEEGSTTYKSSEAGVATVTIEGEIEYTTIAEIHAAGVGTYNIQNVTVVAVTNDSYANSIVTDGTGYLYAYGKLGRSAGDIVTMTGVGITKFNNQFQINDYSEITVIEEGTTINHPTPEVISAADYDTKSQTGNFEVGDYVQLDAELTISGNYLNFTVPGSTQKGSLKVDTDYSAFDGQYVTITGYVLYSGSYYTLFATGVTEGSNYLYTDTASFEWAATATDAKVATVKADHTWSVTSKPEWLTVATDATSVTMTPSVNEVTEAREGKVVLTDELGATWSIDVKQAAATAAGEVVVNFISGDGAAKFSNNSAAGTNSATNGAITILHEKGTNTNAVRLDTPLRVYQGATLTFSGANISKIEFTYSGSSYAKGWTVDTGNGTISTDGLVATYTCDGEANIKFSASGQNRLSKIVVTYTE